ncbi:MAG: hypothetical protein V7L23_30045 [Nostoc sp.]|uniref:hypothetical protein n=1 Tax=Nostoc sp. TaxID=1180 RepID=UPI002FF106E9
MITENIRDELRRVHLELKKPFSANLHEFRELPGGKKWVFLRWQTIRERLDEVAPEWISDYSEIQYLGNDAICRCGITILGVRKEAIASVPISITSSSGKEMSRGSAADRLAAEALKNTAEVWGVGRYLDDQIFTIRYLWDRMHELDDGACGEIRRLSEQYKLGVKQTTKPPLQVLPQTSKKIDRDSLINESNRLIGELEWTAIQGKEYLEKNYGKAGRSLLTDAELLDFVGKLQRMGISVQS